MSAASAEAPLTRVARVAEGTGRLLGRLDALTARIRPWMVLVPLAILGYGVAAWVGSKAVHTGWLYYNGGDGTWYYTTAWMLGHGLIPISSIGYGYPLLIAPLARIGGPNILSGLPYAIFFNVVVLGPIALVCMYGLAKAIAGRRFAYIASALWVIGPVIAIPYFLARYHRPYVGLQLPADLGLTTLGDFPSMVAVLVAAYFAFRALTSGDDLDALTAGLAAGLALAVKPANAAFLPAPALALIVARRPRALLVFTAGLVPSVICLTLWKYRGLGYIPLFHGHQVALADGPGPPQLVGGLDVGQYLHGSWQHLQHNLDGFREFTWSRRLVEWTVVAGLIGLFRRSVPVAVLIGGWLASYMLIKGTSVANFYGGSFFRYLAPAIPAAFLLVLSIPFLIPILGRRLATHGDMVTWPVSRRSRRTAAGFCAFLAIAPIVPILAFSQQAGASTADFFTSSFLMPANTFPLAATVHGPAVTLSWPSQSARGAVVRYGILRLRRDPLACERPSGGSMTCGLPPGGLIARTHKTTFTDLPRPGPWVYRVEVIASVPAPSGDLVLLSRPATVSVPAAAG
ncbi:MAG TPA: hypothetical protein VH063_12190 [Gaiellaceae bacterium]|jgi:hypothetical protein|nr:hypothetical protein [Gaiellaceae bacterium]